jgi:hypothetical protein
MEILTSPVYVWFACDRVYTHVSIFGVKVCCLLLRFMYKEAKAFA